MKPSELTDAQRQDVLTSIAREVSREHGFEWNRVTEHTIITNYRRLMNESADRGDGLRAQIKTEPLD